MKGVRSGCSPATCRPARQHSWQKQGWLRVCVSSMLFAAMMYHGQPPIYVSSQTSCSFPSACALQAIPYKLAPAHQGRPDVNETGQLQGGRRGLHRNRAAPACACTCITTCINSNSTEAPRPAANAKVLPNADILTLLLLLARWL